MSTQSPGIGAPSHTALPNQRLAAFEGTLGRPVGRFDPADGGARAEVLLPRRDPRCRVGDHPAASLDDDHPVAGLDDDHPAASNLRTAVERAGLERARLAVWHLVPWYLEDPEGPSRAESWRLAVDLAGELWPLFPRLTSVVLLGGDTQRAWPRFASILPGVEVVPAPHPSPLAWHRRGAGGVRNSELVVEALRRAAGRGCGPCE